MTANPPLSRARSGSRIRVWAMLVVGALLGLVVVVLWPSASVPSTPKRVPAPVLTRLEAQASQILGLWDRARSRAWALGDIEALAGLYADGAPAGKADVAMLKRWKARGLRVQGLSMQVVSLVVVDHAADRWRLRVTDRVSGADVVGPGVEEVLVDPDKAPGAVHVRAIELRDMDGTWQMVSVKEVT